MGIFKACDIRGVVGQEWGDREAAQIGRAIGHMMRDLGERSICAGGDFRRSTPSLKQALIGGLSETGMLVHDVGQVPTPLVYFAARRLPCRNVAVVTASHNPGEYNGIKILLAGRPGVPELMSQIQARMDAPSPPVPAGKVEPYHIRSAYETRVRQQARELGHRVAEEAGPPPQPLRIVLDTMAGAFTQIAPRVLEAAGHCVVTRHTKTDPDFSAGQPDPANESNLAPLIDAMGQNSAEVGIALDGDGDRVIFVDHTGRVARPEQIGVILLQHGFHCPTVVYDLKCASVLPQSVVQAGGKAVMRPSGHGFMKTAMIDLNAQMGVEASGHHFFGALGGGDDGLFTALLLLEIVGRTRRSLAELVDRVGWPAITSDLRIPFHGDRNATLEKIASGCGGNVTRLDGVRAEYEGGWALARASITEPVLTFRMEGRRPEDLRRIVMTFLAGVPEIRHQILERIDG